MASFGAMIRQIVREESAANATQVSDGVVQSLQSSGEHLVTTAAGLTVGRSVTDENIKVGDIVTVLHTGPDAVILGGKH